MTNVFDKTSQWAVNPFPFKKIIKQNVRYTYLNIYIRFLSVQKIYL